MTRPGRPATSASSVTPRVSFSLGADEYDALREAARLADLSPGRFAKRLVREALDPDAGWPAGKRDANGWRDDCGNYPHRCTGKCRTHSPLPLDAEAARLAFAPDHGPCVECQAHGVVRQATQFNRGLAVCGEHS